MIEDRFKHTKFKVEIPEPRYHIYEEKPGEAERAIEKLHDIPFDEEKVREIIRKSKENFGQKFLFPALKNIGKEFGCIPRKIPELFSKETRFDPAHVLGVITFYSMFVGKPQILVCTGLSCSMRGSERILRNLKEKAKEIEVREWVCLGRCEMGPCALIPFKKVFSEITDEDIDKIVTSSHG